MKYIVRALKHFVYMTLLISLIMLVLVKLGFVEGNLESMFRHGASSVLQMLLIVAVYSAIYPRIGYGKRSVRVPGADEDVYPVLDSYMQEKGYILLSREGEVSRYRCASVLNRITRLFEDTVTVKKVLSGFELEGMTKEIVRLDTGLTYRFNPEEE